MSFWAGCFTAMLSHTVDSSPAKLNLLHDGIFIFSNLRVILRLSDLSEQIYFYYINSCQKETQCHIFTVDKTSNKISIGICCTVLLVSVDT